MKEKIKIYLKLKDIFSETKDKITEMIKTHFENEEFKKNKPEFKNVEIIDMDNSKGKNILNADILITTSTDIEIEEEKVWEAFSKNNTLIIIIDEEFNEKSLKILREPHLRIFGIINAEKLKYEWESMGLLENLIKKAVRKKVYSLYNERDYYKPIDWKFTIGKLKEKEEGDVYKIYDDTKNLTLLRDKSMEDFINRTKYIITEIVEGYKEVLKKINREIKESKGKEEKFLEATKNMERIKLPAIFIQGPTGSGKTLASKWIADMLFYMIFHEEEKTLDHFFRLSIVNIGEELLEGELFGWEEGAFTGAEKPNKGCLRTHTGKVVMLDEIGDLSPHLQTKLLEYLDTMEVLPKGRNEKIWAPCIIIGATNKNVKSAIEKGEFRRDLYARFDYYLKLPPLSERKNDLRFLISFILQNPRINNGAIKKISYLAIEKLEKYDYPANFRELEEVLKMAIINAKNENRDILLSRDIEI